MPDISVIICAYNPRPDYLRRTVDALKTQTLPLQQWELLLIDNASKEHLADVWDVSWHPNARVVREDELGLTSARLRGIKESCGQLLVFVDDDNVLAPDFLEQALAISARYPYLGVLGTGVLEPEFEVSPPPELTRLLPLLAVRHVDGPRWSNHFADFEAIPWGAGMCVTREVAGEYLNLLTKLGSTSFIDCHADHRFGGGDDLFSFASFQLGRGFGLFPSLRITHLIPKERLTRAYFLRLLRDRSTSGAILRYKLSGIMPPEVGLIRRVHILLHGLRNGGFSMRCQWARARGEKLAERLIATQ